MDFNGILLRVKGKTTSFFHSTRRQYASLVQTAPFILGSTLRGALLSTIIRKIDCQDWIRLRESNNSETICSIHGNCNNSCPVKGFFLPYRVIFSFGLFDGDEERLYQRTTRIAIDRGKLSVSEGAIVNIEAVPPETQFIFEMILFGESISFKEEIRRAIYDMAMWEGIGRYRSIGFGQFRIDDIGEFDLSTIVKQRISDIQKKNVEKGIRLVFITPLILGNEKAMLFYSTDKTTLVEKLSREITLKVKMITGQESTQIVIKDVEMKIRPEFIHRFSYEIQNKENRLVGWPGSEFILYFGSITSELYQHLAIISLVGLGEWSEWGFGRFTYSDVEKNDDR